MPGENAADVEFWVLDWNGDGGKGEWVKAPFEFEDTFSILFPPPIQIWDFEGDKAFAKLLNEIFKPLQRRLGREFNELIQKFGSLLDAQSDSRAEEFELFERGLNQKLRPLFPSVNVRLDIPTPSLASFLSTAKLNVLDEDDGFERDIHSMGAGSKRAIQMALVRYLDQVKRHHHNHYLSRTLLLIDSPELFLHPQAVELVRVALKNLSREGYQVIFATHSAQMVTCEDVSPSLLIRKNKERGTCRPCGDYRRSGSAANAFLAFQFERAFVRRLRSFDRRKNGMESASDTFRKNVRAFVCTDPLCACPSGRRQQHA